MKRYSFFQYATGIEEANKKL